jgi:hypothetical protein
MVLKPLRKWMQRPQGLSKLSRNPHRIPLLHLLLQVHRRRHHRHLLVPYQGLLFLLHQDWGCRPHLLKEGEVALLLPHQVEKPQQRSILPHRDRQVRHLSLPDVQYRLHFNHLHPQHYLQKYPWTETIDNQLHLACLSEILIHRHHQNIITLNSMSLLPSMLQSCLYRHQMRRLLSRVEVADYRIHLPFQ